LAQGKYQNYLEKIINRRAVTSINAFGVFVQVTWLISSTVPSWFIPNEDHDVFMLLFKHRLDPH
jgi:HAE1 family hydrophobic/amphiphilic exporter-1